MQYEDHIACLRAFSDTLASIGYGGIGRRGLALCIAAFEAGDKDRAILEYRQTIGDAPNFASVLTDIDPDSLSSEVLDRYNRQLFAVMLGMSLLMKGEPK